MRGVTFLASDFLIKTGEHVVLRRPVNSKQTVPQEQPQESTKVCKKAVGVIDAVVSSDLVLLGPYPERNFQGVSFLLKPVNAIM